MRTQTVTAPQALFMMNSDEIDKASAKLRRPAAKGSGRRSAHGGRISPTGMTLRPAAVGGGEGAGALAYLENDPARLKGFAWLLFNLDEFIYVR